MDNKKDTTPRLKLNSFCFKIWWPFSSVGNGLRENNICGNTESNFNARSNFGTTTNLGLVQWNQICDKERNYLYSAVIFNSRQILFWYLLTYQPCRYGWSFHNWFLKLGAGPCAEKSGEYSKENKVTLT